MRTPRIYVDTSVLGGNFDDEFRVPTRRLFDALLEGRWVALVSDVTVDELADAPREVREFAASLPADAMERVAADEECAELADEYIRAAVVPPSMRGDALHVATAACHGADLVVSWNYRHLVNWARIRGFNAVNLRLGYPVVEIRSPLEVSFDERSEDV
ncbi:MAG: PIN domain-containing protein [Deltaproteobacteria bacterium]|nr:PIN domain-containing protein [Deltaproteobacteria bacterium]